MRARVSARWAAGGAVVAAGMLAAGCGAGSLASPRPQAGTGAARAPSSAAGPDLHYPRKLDASPLTARPCRDLTGSQVRHVIGAKPGDGKPEHHLGVGCGWHPASIDNTSAGSIAIHRQAGDGGLRYFYTIKHEFKYFHPTTVAGFPAVVSSPSAQRAPSGECAINVGVNEHTYFFSDFISGASPPASLKPCGKARQAAKYVIQNLKGGS
jgi:hypothetical protein